MTDVILPSLGFDMTEGRLARWIKNEGERVEKGQAIAEIETEKATVEIEAAASGILAKILVQAGQSVPVGTVIGVIAEPGEEVAASKAPVAAKPPAAPSAPPPEAEKEAAETAAPPEARVKASPVARKMAEEAGLDLSRLKGTGPGGRVVERDVQAAVAARPAPAAPPGVPAGPPAAPPAGETAPLSRMRQTIARRMAESKAKVPHFYVTVEIHMDEAMKMREQLNRLAPEAERISVNDLIVAAAARTLARFPALNASYREGGLEMHPRVNIGVVVSLEDGLIAPVLRGADKKTLATIAAESRAMTERARANKLRSDDLGGGTFTVSNLGMFDVDEFSAIINPPEAAILATGAVTPRPVAAGGEVRIASVMKATLSVDHRVADGAQAGRFLQEFRKLLENPVNLLAV
jgi:pyruvate dehydrogenase E2 component (dihydrolipoamide acetyltransferase)